MDVHSLTNNVAIISKRSKWESGKWSISADNVSRHSYQPIKGEEEKARQLDDPSLWYANIRGRSTLEIKTAHPANDIKRIDKSLPSKAGRIPRRKDKNPKNRKRKGLEGSWKWNLLGGANRNRPRPSTQKFFTAAFDFRSSNGFRVCDGSV